MSYARTADIQLKQRAEINSPAIIVHLNSIKLLKQNSL